MRQIFAAKIFEFAVFERAPDAFLRIDCRRIRGQRFKMKPTRLVFGKMRFEFAAAINGSAVPNQKPLAGNLLFQMFQKRDPAAAVKRFFLPLEQQSSGGRDRAKRRQRLTAAFAAQARRLQRRRGVFPMGAYVLVTAGNQ